MEKLGQKKENELLEFILIPFLILNLFWRRVSLGSAERTPGTFQYNSFSRLSRDRNLL